MLAGLKRMGAGGADAVSVPLQGQLCFVIAFCAESTADMCVAGKPYLGTCTTARGGSGSQRKLEKIRATFWDSRNL